MRKDTVKALIILINYILHVCKNTILGHFTPIIIKKVISCTKNVCENTVCFILCLDVGRYKLDNLVCLPCGVFLIFSIVDHI